MIEENTRTDLQQRQWIFDVKDINLIPQGASFVSLWKQYTNGVAIALSIHSENGQFALYQDVGHAASGTKRTNCGTFSTADAAVHQLIQECDSWDNTWGI
ncbi:hypothetical protein H6F78_04775 [Coleofasciculus sp. FACHB-64]|uniref:hypothetical protein n=1 Tax=Cyanophyceae TaxID=3028117 RepID=UPI0016833E8B|nr:MULTISPECIES: hypothetical protein [unclassified Coleofasciculus]MBD1840062.1 hypothetical protein [Coleofasciculus sp. FACHB-501]MBD1893862.1 hypothetical protein [Coleofasciculus sp. FACHB-129]MBD2044953.1 hypothetical protein [Coleofasciculus sp. FACHB-64]MBD2540837.1 hypothetical protein [Coleofasciculus sp. FACHB-SPT36]